MLRIELLNVSQFHYYSSTVPNERGPRKKALITMHRIDVKKFRHRTLNAAQENDQKCLGFDTILPYAHGPLLFGTTIMYKA